MKIICKLFLTIIKLNPAKTINAALALIVLTIAIVIKIIIQIAIEIRLAIGIYG